MSLINDALKRAKQAQQKTAPPPVAAAPLRPIEASPARGAGLGMLVPIAIALILLLVGVVVIWMAVARGGKKPAPVIADSKPESLPVAVQPAAVPAAKPPPPVPTVDKKPVPVPAVAPVASPSVATNLPPVALVAAPPATAPVVESVPVTNVAPVVVPAPPALPKLQGIFYRPDRPSALLNGKTVLIGGRSGEFLVIAITQQSVTVVRSGMTNILSLPD